MRALFPLVVLLAGACNAIPKSVLVSGQVVSEPDGTQGLPGVTLGFYDDAAALVDEVDADDAGLFVAEVPAGLPVFAVVNRDDYVPASFSGVAGLADFTVDPGIFYGLSPEMADPWLERFEGCPAETSGEGMVYGDVRLYQLSDPVTGEHPIVTTASVRLLDFNGDWVSDGCYLHPLDGDVYEPRATKTGLSGQFMIRGLQPGVYTLRVSYVIVDDATSSNRYQIYVPPRGAVPMLPAYVELSL